MVEIRDKVTYLTATDAISVAANAEFKNVIEYVKKYIDRNFRSGKNNLIVFYGNATTKPSESLDLSWEVTDQELDQVIIQALTEFNEN